MSDLVDIQWRQGIATVTLNRPDKRNALSLELIEALERSIPEVSSSPALRVLVLAGAGRCFCAGMDLRGVLDDAQAMGDMLRGLARVATAIRRLPVPTIARVQGAAVGGGCGLMVVPDFAVTHPEAKLGYPEVSLGVCPAVVAPWLIRKIGAGRARAMLLEGGTISGHQAVEIGLATHLAPRDDLTARTDDLAARLAEGGREALAVTKAWVNTLDGSLDEAEMRRAADLSADVISGQEAQQRLRRLFGEG